MSSLGYLENLNNKELRAKCIEFGLPNVPVTDSSRSVLIRKLLGAMGEGDAKKKTTTRRDTVHTSPSRNRSTAQSHSPGRNQNNNRPTAHSHSPSRNQNNNRSTAQSHSPSRNQNNNRRTIAATNYKQQEAAVETPSYTAPPSPPAITKVRNSSIRENVRIVPMEVDLRDCSDEEDYTFSKQSTSTSGAAINYVYNNNPTYNPHQRTPTLSLSKTNVMSTSFNQESQPSFHVQDRQYNSYVKPMQIPPAPPSQQRANRSASLSKSGVMTTSYRQETAPLSSQYEEDAEDDGVVKSNSYDKVPSTYDRSQYQSLMQQSNTQKLPFEPLVNASTSAYNTQNYGANPLNSTSRYSPLEAKAQYKLPPARNMSPPSRPTMLPPSRPSMLPPSRPTMSSPTQNRLYPTLPTHHSTTYGLTAEEQDDDVEEIIESEEDEEVSGSDDQLETPFLSKFTRNLNTTQPEAFGRNYSKPVSPALRASYSSADAAGYNRSTYDTADSLRRSGASSGYNSGSQHYYDRGNMQARRSIGHDDDDDNEVAASFRQFLATLNNKYHLKQFLIAFMIFVLSVFVYVVFLQK